MKIAIQNSFPNISVSAEREFIARFLIAGRSLGWTVKDVVTSDDICAFAPDAVIVTHEFTPKLTRFPTLGLIWGPVAFFGQEPDRIRNILSYDGYLVASQSLRDFVEALLAEHGKSAPVSAFDFLPTALGDVAVAPDYNKLLLFYAGVHWDGDRHNGLFAELQGKVPLSIHGAASKWASAGKDYHGTIPFDGRSVATEIARCGVALSLHTPAHRDEGIPSMRLFEAASAGAVILSDRIAFATREFGDCLLYVDPNAGASAVANQIVAHIQRLAADPAEAKERGTRAQEIFRQRFTLEAQLAQLPGFIGSVTRSMAHADAPDAGLVEVIVRVGSRPIEMVRRAVQSIADQTYTRIALLIVSFRDVPGLDAVLAEFAPRFEYIRRISVPDNGVRSTALWAGFNAAEAKFLANLDDDDAIHPTHIASQVHCLVNHPSVPVLVYSGVIEVQEEAGHWFEASNFSGDIGQVIEERRRLRFLDPFSRERLLRFDNFIQSNAWTIRRSALTADILVDPGLKVAEDMLFYLMLLDRGPFVPTWRATAEWNWRSTSMDNSMFASDLWQDNELLLRRLAEAGISPVMQGAMKDPSLSGLRSRFVSILRRPSILFGPFAPRWRRFKAGRRANPKSSHTVRSIKVSLKSVVNGCGLYISSMKSQRRRETVLLAYDVLQSDLNRVIEEKNLFSADRDRLLAERNALQTDRDAIMAERDDQHRESRALRDEREGLYTDMDTLFEIVLNASSAGSGKAQLNQDVLALVVNRFKTGGFFVEFGATNGVDLSNTYLLEKNYGWTGILAEPATVWHEDLAKNRQCIIDTDCVWSKTGETLNFDIVQEGEFSTISSFSDSDSHAAKREAKTTFKVKTISLLDLLTRHAAPNRIDYLSVDTEGSEYEILKDFDFDAYSFNFISVEHNFTRNREKLKNLLEANGYRRICEHISRWDDWYIPA